MGDQCNECLPGYTGNPKKGEPCVANEQTPLCDCNPSGTLLPCQEQENKCTCKVQENNYYYLTVES